RMKPEKRCDRKARPAVAGHSLERGEQDDRSQSVQNHVRQVMTPWREPEQLVIDHVRQPRQGMPVSPGEGVESPRDTSSGNTPPNVIVAGYVLVVVKIDKATLDRREERVKEQTRQQNGKRGCVPRNGLRLSIG